MFVLAKLKMYLYAAGALVVAFGAAFAFGKSSANQKHERERADDYIKTRQRIDAADTGSDPDAAADWLRERQQQSKRDL
mgnify:CR=1 FL=1